MKRPFCSTQINKNFGQKKDKLIRWPWSMIWKFNHTHKHCQRFYQLSQKLVTVWCMGGIGNPQQATILHSNLIPCIMILGQLTQQANKWNKQKRIKNPMHQHNLIQQLLHIIYILYIISYVIYYILYYILYIIYHIMTERNHVPGCPC